MGEKAKTTSWLEGLRAFYVKAQRIIRYFKPYWKNWLGLFILANFSTALSLVNPLILKFFIDVVLIGKNIAFLHTLMGFFILVAFLGTLISLFVSYYYTKLNMDILFDVRNELFQHLEDQDVSFFKDRKLGDILSRLTGDIESIEMFISLIFNSFIVSVITLVFIFVISASMHLRLTLIAMVVVPGVVLTQHYYAGKLREMYRAVREKSADFLSYLQERLSVVPLIKLFTQEDAELDREKRKARELIDMNLGMTLTSGTASATTGLLVAGALIFILWYGSHQVIIGALSIGSLIAIYTYISQLFGPIGALTGLNVALQTTMVSAERVFEFLDVQPKVRDKARAKPLPEIQGEIRFEDVSFAYEEKEPVLEHINFVIEPGQSVGLVGPSGVGKTTLVQLITRFYDPTSGQVLIDGEDLIEVQLRSLRRQMGEVTQEVVLFNATIRENLLYGKPEASFEEIVEAAKIAGIHDYIVSLPRGYETELGERGLRLSQGQRQRIALARVVLKDPKIFLLDEATSSLDSESEMRIQRAIEYVMRGRTTIIIAHRLATIQSVDRILVLSGNQLVEEGTFSELIDKKGQFYDLYMAQFGGYHAFRQKLDYEMKRSREYQESMLLLGLCVSNYSEILSQRGKEKTEEVLQGISNIICQNIREIDFICSDPRQRNLFYVALPQVKAPELEEIKNKIREKIPPEFELRIDLCLSHAAISNVDELINECKEKLCRPCEKKACDQNHFLS